MEGKTGELCALENKDFEKLLHLLGNLQGRVRAGQDAYSENIWESPAFSPWLSSV